MCIQAASRLCPHNFCKASNSVNVIECLTEGTQYAKGTSPTPLIVCGETVSASIYCLGRHNPLADSVQGHSFGCIPLAYGAIIFHLASCRAELRQKCTPEWKFSCYKITLYPNFHFVWTVRSRVTPPGPP